MENLALFTTLDLQFMLIALPFVVAYFLVGMSACGFHEAMDQDLNPRRHSPNTPTQDYFIAFTWPVSIPLLITATLVTWWFKDEEDPPPPPPPPE